MEDTKSVLIIINAITEDEITSIKQAISASNQLISVHLLYVKPRLPTYYFHIPSMITLADHCEKEAKDALTSIGEILNVEKNKQWIATGKVKSETTKLAKHLGANFILAGATEHEQLSHCFSISRTKHPCIETIAGVTKCFPERNQITAKAS
jgi:hypothetical protein